MAKNALKELNFWEHLEELRWHLIRAIAAVFICGVVAFVAKAIIFDIILLAPRHPQFITNAWLSHWAEVWNMPALKINQQPLDLQSIQLSGQLGVHITVSMVVGFIIAFPYVFYQLWSFISPALHPQERKHTRYAIFVISLLFFTGVLFGYFIIAPLAINFLGEYNVSTAVANTINLNSYISTVTSILLSGGVIFELPVLIYFLVKIGLIDAVFLRKYRKHALVLIMIVSAIITPPDPFSLVLVALPLYLLYEAGGVIAAVVNRKRMEIAKK